MRILLLLLPFFFILSQFLSPLLSYSYSNILYNQPILKHSLEYLDSKNNRIYPIALSKKQSRIIVVPHSTHENAQCLIAATYRVIQEQSFDKIILVCASNSCLFHGVAVPWGMNNACFVENICLEFDALEKLVKHQLFYYYQAPFCDNVGLQLHCRLLHFYIKNVIFLPLIVGKISKNDACHIADLLANNCSPETLIILSGDIACYKNLVDDCPLDSSILCKVYDQDVGKIQALQSELCQQQVDVFYDTATSSIFALLCALLRLPQFKNLESYFVGYATSGCDISNFTDSTIGNEVHQLNMNTIETYGAFIFQESDCGYRNCIGVYEQRELLKCARLGLCHLFEMYDRRLPCMISYEMARHYGAFVSLYAMSDHGVRLQGCMGKVQSKLPLHEMVYQMSQQAACKDLRFHPLRCKEIDTTIISLSVIIDVKKIHHYDEIKESDGILLQSDDKLAMHFPSLMPVANWNYESILIDLSNEIGSYHLLWKKSRTKVFTFHSLVFQEE